MMMMDGVSVRVSVRVKVKVKVKVRRPHSSKEPCP